MDCMETLLAVPNCEVNVQVSGLKPRAHLTHDTRTCCGQRKQFIDTAKHYMKNGQIDINAWELMVANRPHHIPGNRPSIGKTSSSF